ncbi:MAG: DUF86 domain-containing protein [Armatimonadetes bacterium]|nr:DUF86 domain-containing protein [Armatimonadota bacterium]NCP34943.1 DUF86 domain-containing protein [Armatimonadota bacterium]
MLDYAREGIGFAQGKYRQDLDSDRKLAYALTHVIEIIGEAANQAPADERDKHPEIPWADIIGMRHKLIHGYNLVDLEIVWRTAQEDLPALVRQLEQVLPPIDDQAQCPPNQQ